MLSIAYPTATYEEQKEYVDLYESGITMVEISKMKKTNKLRVTHLVKLYSIKKAWDDLYIVD